MQIGSATGHILIVEDDPIVREIVATSLRRDGFVVSEARCVAEATESTATRTADLVIVDVRLPDGSGHDLVTRLRAGSDPAIIFMSALGGAGDRLRGLEQGDDYLIKPIDLGELHARVRAVLRRYRRSYAPGALVELASWTLDLVRRELADATGAPIGLTRAEFDLLAALVQARGVILSREYLLEVIATGDKESKARTVDVLVSRIRRKLAGGPLVRLLQTVPGTGYRWADLP